MKRHIEEDSRGPASAQKHLRDLAHSLPPLASSSRRGEEEEEEGPATPEASGEEGGLLEFQDVTDYGNRYMQKLLYIVYRTLLKSIILYYCRPETIVFKFKNIKYNIDIILYNYNMLHSIKGIYGSFIVL